MVGGTSQRLHIVKPDENLDITMDGFRLTESEEKCEKLLGVTLQPNLKWNKHVQEVQSKLKDRLTGLMKTRFIVTYPFRKIVAEGIFTNVLTYCIPAWGGLDKGDLQDLQVMQNKAAQIVMNLPPRSNRKMMYTSLGWLTVNQLIFFHSVLAVSTIRKTSEPEYLASYLSNDNFRGKIIVPQTTLTLAKRSFCFRGAEAWNIVPEEIRSLEKIDSFKRELKKWTLTNVDKFT